MRKIASIILSAMIGISSIIVPGISARATSIRDDANLLNTYGKVFDNVGSVLYFPELMNEKELSYVKQECNSITLKDITKPSSILGESPELISIGEAKGLGYYIPDNYPEKVVPKLKFVNVDRMLRKCYEKQLKIRGPELICNGGTPEWYFKKEYNKNAEDVSSYIMEKRMEFYIKSYMKHVYSMQYGSVIYTWDVVKQYLSDYNLKNSGWERIFKNRVIHTSYEKQAFMYAYEFLESKGLTDSVKLFYNGNNERKCFEDRNLIQYINIGKKICSGAAIRSHFNTNSSLSDYEKALNMFRGTDLELQITELQVGCKDLDVQAKYYYNLMRTILKEKKSGINITALIFGGMTDKMSNNMIEMPFLYSSFGNKKAAYDAVMQAYYDEYIVEPAQEDK